MADSLIIVTDDKENEQESRVSRKREKPCTETHHTHFYFSNRIISVQTRKERNPKKQSIPRRTKNKERCVSETPKGVSRFFLLISSKIQKRNRIKIVRGHWEDTHKFFEMTNHLSIHSQLQRNMIFFGNFQFFVCG